jgi:CHAT domain-containing protein
VTDETASFLWLIGRDDAAFVRSDLGSDDLAKLVRAIRKSVDLEQWPPPPFDTGSAYALYSRLLGPLGDRLSRYRRLVFVGDGPMLSLPLGILIDHPVDAPKDKDYSAYSGYPWLAAKYVISNTPTVSSFLLLRRGPKEPEAKAPFTGFGNPLVGNGKGTNRGATAAMAFAHGAGVNRSLFSLLQPLPETAGELTLIMKALGGSDKNLHLGRDATEDAVKSANLQQVGTIAFATHALLAGEFQGLAEPALILTPPKKPKGDDDGLLTSSEVAGLKIDADWVILSACNTAGPDGTPGAEGYSGLTQAFFYAGARSLLVSHWSVESNATVLLTSGTVQRLAASPELGRAGALQQSMLELISGKHGAMRSHPALWGPFVLVGDGGVQQ